MSTQIRMLGWGAPDGSPSRFGFSATDESDLSDVSGGDGAGAGYTETGGGQTNGSSGGSAGSGGSGSSSDVSVQQSRCQALGQGNWDAKAGKCVTAAEKNKKWWIVGGAGAFVALCAGGYALAKYGY